MKILVVDDELTTLKTLEFFARNLGYEEVLTASDGIEAWEIWKKERPRIVITDWKMPRMNGLELCTRIRENEGSDYTYLVIVTAQNSSQNVVLGMKAGADDYITKPFNREELYFRLKAGERVLNLQSKDMVIFVLAKLAESRDTDTGNHLERVRHFCRALAENIAEIPNAPVEIDSKFIDNIFLTSPLHDIGKVGIPDHILLKRGQLSDDEFSIMKTHTIIGYNTLNEALQKNPKADYLKMSAEIALHHHEKFDGSGYPYGRKEEEIPLSARIVALADVYDALTSNRSYKEVLPHNTAVSIIRMGEGKHFDPIVIRSFNNCLNRFVEINNRFKAYYEN
jgi:putative two-component system response regulator